MDQKKFGLFDPEDEDILHLIPSSAKRVKVQDIDGQEKWRDPNEFLCGDKVIIENGEPRLMFRTPGRKSKKEEEEEDLPEATTEDAAKRQQQKQKFLERDELLKLAKNDPDNDHLLGHLIEGLAEEAASLAYERNLRESRNQETSQTSLRRVNTLKAMAEIYLKRKDQMSDAVIDLKSPQFFVLFQFIMETFIECMKNAHIDEDAVAVVMDNVQNALKENSWASLAIRKMKGE